MCLILIQLNYLNSIREIPRKPEQKISNHMDKTKDIKPDNLDIVYTGMNELQELSSGQFPHTGSSKQLSDRTKNGRVYGIENDLTRVTTIKQESLGVSSNVCICHINSQMTKP